MELQPVLHCHIVIAAPHYKTVLLSEVGLIWQCCLTFIIHIFHTVARHLDKAARYGQALLVYAYAVSLHHGSVAIDVDHESRNVVAFTMYEAVGVVVRVVDNAYRLSHPERRPKTRRPELVVDGNVAERQHPYGNRPYLIVTYCYKLTTGSDDSHHFAFFQLTLGALYGTGENPWVEAFQTFFLTLLEIYFPVHCLLVL